MKYLYHHLGLGDHIICNGLVRSLVTTEDYYRLIVKEHNLGSVRFMYRDLKNLECVPVRNDLEANYLLSRVDPNRINTYMIGFSINPNIRWDELFYRQMGIPFEYRWSKFYLERDHDSEIQLYQKLNPNDEKFVLIHNFGSGPRRFNNDYPKNDLKKIFVEKITDNMFDFLTLVDKAEEIHCIESSFQCLVDSLNLNKKLYYHLHDVLASPNQRSSWIVV